MLQRNVSGYAKVFPTLEPPVTVYEGGTIDHPELLPGFEQVEHEQVELPVTPVFSEVAPPVSPLQEANDG